MIEKIRRRGTIEGWDVRGVILFLPLDETTHKEDSTAKSDV